MSGPDATRRAFIQVISQNRYAGEMDLAARILFELAIEEVRRPGVSRDAVRVVATEEVQ